MNRTEVISYLAPVSEKYNFKYNADYLFTGVLSDLRIYYPRINSISRVPHGYLVMCPGVTICFYDVGRIPSIRIYDTGL